MTDRIGDFQNNRLIGEESQRPFSKTLRRQTASCCDDLYFLQSVEFFRHGRQSAFFAIPCRFKTFGHKLLANVTDGLKTHAGQFVDLFVRPILPVGVGLEQNDGTFDFLRCSFQFFDDDFQFPAFLIGKPNDLFFRIA